jgi:hypothetical protein
MDGCWFPAVRDVYVREAGCGMGNELVRVLVCCYVAFSVSVLDLWGAVAGEEEICFCVVEYRASLGQLP